VWWLLPLDQLAHVPVSKCTPRQRRSACTLIADSSVACPAHPANVSLDESVVGMLGLVQMSQSCSSSRARMSAVQRSSAQVYCRVQLHAAVNSDPRLMQAAHKPHSKFAALYPCQTPPPHQQMCARSLLTPAVQFFHLVRRPAAAATRPDQRVLHCAANRGC
jgi:hypothetical protein